MQHQGIEQAKEQVKTLLEQVRDHYDLGEDTKLAIQRALHSLDDPIAVFEAADQIVLDRWNREKSWNAFKQDGPAEIKEIPEDFFALSFGSGRSRAAAFSFATLNGGLLVKTRVGTILYDPGADFHRAFMQYLKVKGGWEIPKVDYIFVSHAHDDHYLGLPGALTIFSNFFSMPISERPVIVAPETIQVPSDFVVKRDLDFLKIFHTMHGNKYVRTEIYHFLINNEALLITDSQVFERIAGLDPLKDSIPAPIWIAAIREGEYVLTKPFEEMVDHLSSIGGVEKLYLTPQCSDILPGEFPKISTAYMLASRGLCKEIILHGWGTENVFGGSITHPRMTLAKIWAYSVKLFEVCCLALDDYENM